jgi:hypothetical protein
MEITTESHLINSITVAEGKSAVIGKIIYSSNHEPASNIPIRLGEVYWDDEHKNAAFVLEGATSPGAISVMDGTFIINDVPPSEYVIIIGDITDKYEIIEENPDTAKIYNLIPDKVIDIGIIEVNLPH